MARGRKASGRIRGGFGNTTKYAKPIKNRAKFVKKHSVKTFKQLIKQADS